MMSASFYAMVWKLTQAFLQPPTIINRGEVTYVNLPLTLTTFEICWWGLDCRWLRDAGACPVRDQIAVHCMHRFFLFPPQGCSSIIFLLLPSSCLPLLCLYYGLLIVWQDWQAPWQSWLKALRSEKWDRYRANTCLLAVSQSPVGCVLHWHRINGSIKTQPRQVFLAHVTMLLWLAKNISPLSSSFYFPLPFLQFCVQLQWHWPPLSSVRDCLE